MSGKHTAPRPRRLRRRTTILLATPAFLAAAFGASAASAAPAKTPTPHHSRPAVHAATKTCNIRLGGGEIRVTLTPFYDTGAYAGYSVEEENLVPRRIHWIQNAIVDNIGDVQRGPGGTMPYGDTQWWTARGIYYYGGAWFTGQARDSRGNYGWNSCYLS